MQTDNVASPTVTATSAGSKRIQELAEENARLRALAEENRRLQELVEENARLRALADETVTVPPPRKADSRRSSAFSFKNKPILIDSDQSSDDDTLHTPAEDVQPLREIIDILRTQLAAQSASQDALLSQFGELRSSHARLQASASDVTDELIVLRQQSTLLKTEVQDERKRREELEKAKTEESDKVATLRAKVEESRRAVMRLQDEAAQRRNSDSRRSSLTLMTATPGSTALFESGTPTTACNSRRASLDSSNASPLPVLHGPNLGLGFDMRMDSSRRCSVASNSSQNAAVARTQRRHSSFALPGAFVTDENGKVDLRSALAAAAESAPVASTSTPPATRGRDSLCGSIPEEREGDGNPSLRRVAATNRQRFSVDSNITTGPAPVSGLRSLSLSAAPSMAAEIVALKAQLAALQGALQAKQKRSASLPATEPAARRRSTELRCQSATPAVAPVFAGAFSGFSFGSCVELVASADPRSDAVTSSSPGTLSPMSTPTAELPNPVATPRQSTLAQAV